jgi:hypothetical protein
VGASPPSFSSTWIQPAESHRTPRNLYAAIVDRFARARPETDLPYHVDPDALSRYLCTIVQGMSVHASNGMSEAELRGLIDIVLEMWPSP